MHKDNHFFQDVIISNFYDVQLMSKFSYSTLPIDKIDTRNHIEYICKLKFVIKIDFYT